MDSSYGMYLSGLDKNALNDEKTRLTEIITKNVSEMSASFNERLIQEAMKENDDSRRKIKKINELLEVIAQQEAANS